jgi:hypothetical protein
VPTLATARRFLMSRGGEVLRSDLKKNPAQNPNMHFEWNLVKVKKEPSKTRGFV